MCKYNKVLGIPNIKDWSEEINMSQFIKSNPSLLDEFQQKIIRTKFPDYSFDFDNRPDLFIICDNNGEFLRNAFIEWEYEDGWHKKFSLEEIIEDIQDFTNSK